jgi:hypothetical protein
MTILSHPLQWWMPRLALVVLFGLGIYGLLDALALGIVAGIVAFVLLARWRAAVLVIVRLAGAALTALIALIGFDVLLGWLGLKPSIPLGLVLAVVLFAPVAYLYLRDAGWRLGTAIVTAVALAVAVIVGAPVLYGVLHESGSESVPTREPVASRLDVLIVTDGHPHPSSPEPPPEPAPSGFDVSYSVGFAAGDRVRWTLRDGASSAEALQAAGEGDRRTVLDRAPLLRQGADSVLLLMVDGTAPVVAGVPEELPDVLASPGEVAHWQQIAAAAEFPGTPAFALLQTTQPGRLRSWRHFATPGGAVSAQALGSRTATDAAVRLAVSAPTSQADFALAMEYRPVLLFDQAEPVPRPLSIAALFEEERVRLCQDRGVAETDCSEPLASAAELENGGTHLGLRPAASAELQALARQEKAEAEKREAEPVEEGTAGSAPPGTPPPGTPPPATPGPRPGLGSAIYVHPVSAEREGRQLLYLDYWWYLPENPSSVGGGAFCGAGLVITGLTCENHESDWEGMTVIVDRTGRKPFVTAVQYAEHSSVVRFGWQLLTKRWERNPELAQLSGAGAGAPSRPLAFVAKGTHATYPLPCDEACHQVAAPDLGDGIHRGNLPWSGNDSGACGRSSCLQLLPTREAGRQPALWNGFTGGWGAVHCFLNYYCDSGTPPKSPGQQGRYRHPTQYDGIVGSDWQFHRQAFED